MGDSKIINMSFRLKDNDYVAVYVSDEEYNYFLTSFNLMNEEHLLLFKQFIYNLKSIQFNFELDKMINVIKDYESRIKLCL